MKKISKIFSWTIIAILGVLWLIWKICISIISWLLAGRTPASVIEKNMNFGFNSSGTSSSIHWYWWGGISVSIEQRHI